jgi:hypothetical protein
MVGYTISGIRSIGSFEKEMVPRRTAMIVAIRTVTGRPIERAGRFMFRRLP